MPRLDLRFSGTISGGRYFLAGVWLFAIKFLIDHLVASLVFKRNWTPIDYIAPGLNFGSLLTSWPDRWFYGTMMLIALPFTYIGLVLTVQRLRDAGLSQWLVFVFFLPVGNVLYFIILAMIPSRAELAAVPVEAIPAEPLSAQPVALGYGIDEVARSGFASRFPEHAGASAAVAMLLPIPIVAGLVALATQVFRSYGLGVFIGMPFLLGWLSVMLHGMRRPRSLRQSIGVAMGSFFVSGTALVIFAIEGLGCLVMLLPLAFPIVFIGALLGHACQKRSLPAQTSWQTLGALLIVLPLLMGAERIAPAESPLIEVCSSVEIDAPPRVVWEHVIDFPPLDEPKEWIFRAGVAYPMRATIDGAGPGAIRRCVFSTGAFVEPIEVWDAPRLLKFSVTSNPPPMREWSPYRIHPPHLENFLVSEAGQFRLIELPGGRTRLEGTTWYRHGMFPAAYWSIWSDYLIHRIHLRVLEHVKKLSEASGSAASGA